MNASTPESQGRAGFRTGSRSTSLGSNATAPSMRKPNTAKASSRGP